MNGVLCALVLEEVHKRRFTRIKIGNSTEFENDERLNSDPVKRFQKWDIIGKTEDPV